ncbi:MAG: hypothetical protein LBC43_03985 [Bifidobacteriaceae bacterium]|jgi:DNA-binding transcriptional MocR family regulator|nr:hypothetical protein [Bifidobacteriaceae bacterium]
MTNFIERLRHDRKTLQELAKTKSREQIANYYGVSSKTLYRALQADQELNQIVSQGRASMAGLLEQSLFHIAFHGTTTTKVITHPNGTKTVITETKPPSSNLLKFLLCNLDPEHWQIDPSMTALKKQELKLKRQETAIVSPALLKLRSIKDYTKSAERN